MEGSEAPVYSGNCQGMLGVYELPCPTKSHEVGNSNELYVLCERSGELKEHYIQKTGGSHIPAVTAS